MAIKGIGGVFIKVKNKQETINWYKEKLNLSFQDDAVIFEKFTGQSEVFALFNQDSEYFGNHECMINFRVENLLQFLEELKKKGVKAEDKVGEYDYGKFAWIYDINGNKIELWEPVESEPTDQVQK
jgi:glyoxylase I family protein